MITEFFMNMFAGLQDWFLGFFGDDDPPAWIAEASTFVTDLFNSVAGLGGWVPFVVIGAVAGVLFTVWAVLWGIKGLRWVYGLTPFGGGT